MEKKTYSSADIKAKANAHDVNLVVVGSRSMTTSAVSCTIGIHAVICWHRIVDGVVHRNSGATSDAWLLNMATREALQVRISSVVTVGLKLDAEFVLYKS